VGSADLSIGRAPPALRHVDFGVRDWLIHGLAGKARKAVEVTGYMSRRMTVCQKRGQSRRNVAQLVDLSFV
jgi:hypothetical protein